MSVIGDSNVLCTVWNYTTVTRESRSRGLLRLLHPLLPACGRRVRSSLRGLRRPRRPAADSGAAVAVRRRAGRVAAAGAQGDGEAPCPRLPRGHRPRRRLPRARRRCRHRTVAAGDCGRAAAADLDGQRRGRRVAVVAAAAATTDSADRSERRHRDRGGRAGAGVCVPSVGNEGTRRGLGGSWPPSPTPRHRRPSPANEGGPRAARRRAVVAARWAAPERQVGAAMGDERTGRARVWADRGRISAVRRPPGGGGAGDRAGRARN